MQFAFVDGPEPVSGRGPEAMWMVWHDVLSAWQDHRAIAEEYRELDDGGILTLTAFRARGRASGIELTQVLTRGASPIYVHGGRVTRLTLYWDCDRALADLGLN